LCMETTISSMKPDETPIPVASGPSEEAKIAAEEEIRQHQREVDYETKEYPVEVLVRKYLEGLKDDTNEIFIPDYQREMAWDTDRQSKFIESVLIGLPIPYLFVADVKDLEGEPSEKGGRLEIVDGSQRIRTLAAFMSNKLPLGKLEKLGKLTGFLFRDLPQSRQRRFGRRTLRLIELTENADEDVRRDIFERINTGSVELEDMEKRRGIKQGPMLTLVQGCAGDTLFHVLAPLTGRQVSRRDREELVLRFFAYLERYQDFGEKNQNRVVRFLDTYLADKNKLDQVQLEPLAAEFRQMLEFVRDLFPEGFAKTKGARTTPRIRFEALAVGTALALRTNPNLPRPQAIPWLDSAKFKELTTSDSSNSRPKVVKRIEYVRDKLLGTA
jgi:hypothetical protein